MSAWRWLAEALAAAILFVTVAMFLLFLAIIQQPAAPDFQRLGIEMEMKR